MKLLRYEISSCGFYQDWVFRVHLKWFWKWEESCVWTEIHTLIILFTEEQAFLYRISEWFRKMGESWRSISFFTMMMNVATNLTREPHEVLSFELQHSNDGGCLENEFRNSLHIYSFLLFYVINDLNLVKIDSYIVKKLEIMYITRL